ncbi:hypothetical protein JF546_18965 [Nitratireductor aquimarinus]|uniref:hypothetical protein n=1 Tax=Nitratireductor TaxID=245876 RepID=UPI001A8BF8DF|nr:MULTISPECIES: hypothetical protein [Nitratireductor]MBN8245103.1 hypothetical protein [Nitratireductor aquimarinus]MBY6133488.1 hypothetical protein [Nitratireductor aquimarinus]MCA1304861.1 hypothetical protein [Nitratireductor aquimarinus]MCV0350241.1 hypothetical protein [Nitratireductor sp.]
MSKKFEVTMVETLIHTFTVEVESENDVDQAANEMFTQAEKLSDLEDYNSVVSLREVEDAQPL